MHIDARLAAVALSHLLANAARYSPRRQRNRRSTHGVNPAGVKFTVTDQGRGIDDDDRDHLFERFYRGRQAKQATSGTGMGLAIARGLLNAIGGEVWADNAPGAGARFSMLVRGETRAHESEE